MLCRKLRILTMRMRLVSTLIALSSKNRYVDRKWKYSPPLTGFTKCRLVYEAMYCYWPNANPTQKVKKGALPDTERWSLHPIRIFSYTDDYNKALELRNHAEDTSNIEIDHEESEKRPKKTPKRFRDSVREEENEADDEEEMPCMVLGQDSLPSLSLPVPLPVPPQPESGSNRPLVNRNLSARKVTPSVSSAPSSTLSQLSTPAQGSGADSFHYQGLSVTSVMKLDTILENQKEIMSILRNLAATRACQDPTEDIEDILPNHVSTPEELGALGQRVLADGTFRKKMVCYLTSLGGYSATGHIRRLLKKIGPNSLWSLYSLKGRKGKLPFLDTPLCRVMIKSCRKNYPRMTVSGVEDILTECLKHAPTKKGGTRFKESSRTSLQATAPIEDLENDDDI